MSCFVKAVAVLALVCPFVNAGVVMPDLVLPPGIAPFCPSVFLAIVSCYCIS